MHILLASCVVRRARTSCHAVRKDKNHVLRMQSIATRTANTNTILGTISCVHRVAQKKATSVYIVCSPNAIDRHLKPNNFKEVG